MTDISQIFQGTQIILPGSAALGMNPSTWVIDEKLYENRIDGLREPTSDPEEQPSGWEAKYLCHNQHSPYTQAFMRVYCQGPDEGTEFLLPEIRSQQANPDFEKQEAEARKALQEGHCQSLPSLLGYGQFKQKKKSGPVPGGYITYLIWGKVPGDMLTKEFFWSLEEPKRDFIPTKFRAAYQDLLSIGWVPGREKIRKILWKNDSEDLWISGFRSSHPIDREWNDWTLASYGLIKPPASGVCGKLDEWER